MNKNKVIVTTMKPRERQTFSSSPKKKMFGNNISHQRLHRKNVIFAAAFLCLCGCAAAVSTHPQQTQAVMSHLTAGFEYDETLGRLQFVSNLLPKSAMVFLTTSEEPSTMTAPADAEILHVWSQAEPWLEYACSGDIVCCQDGQVMTIVKNRQDEYTVRLMHENGYESVYSGLTHVLPTESETVSAGETIGTAGGFAAFELRKDGLSVLPVFDPIQ